MENDINLKEIKFNEFELLTLREGLFSIKNNKKIINEEEFKQIDNKIKLLVSKITIENEI